MTEPRKQLRRSRSDRMFGGVIGGIAAYLGVDSTAARVVYVIASILSVAFPGLLVYLILWVVIPQAE